MGDIAWIFALLKGKKTNPFFYIVAQLQSLVLVTWRTLPSVPASLDSLFLWKCPWVRHFIGLA